MKYVLVTDVLQAVVAVDENEIPTGKTPKEYVTELYGRESLGGFPLLEAKVNSTYMEATELLGIPAGMGQYLKHNPDIGHHLDIVPLETGEEETTIMIHGEMKSVLSDHMGAYIPPTSFAKRRPISNKELPDYIRKLKMEGTPRICVDCGNKFTLTVMDQDFFESRNLPLPKRCVSCRERRRKKSEEENMRFNTI